MVLNIDKELLKKFEMGLNPRYPEKSLIPAIILGYGEISTVFELQYEGQQGIVYKRMPIFDSYQQVDHYITIYNEYNKILLEIGIDIPEYGSAAITTEKGNIVLFITQQKLTPESFGNRIIHTLPDNKVYQLVLNVLRNLKKIWDFNKESSDIRIGVDGQISNWAVRDLDVQKPDITSETGLFYIDTSTPLIRKNGKEMLESELFLKSTPSFLRWLIKWFFLKEVLDRYYDFRLVIIDMIANFFKEGRPDLIPHLIKISNAFIKEEAHKYNIAEIQYKEVESYYKNDAFIWSLFQKLRRFDRFLKTRILMGQYPYILPGHIKR